MAPSPRTTSTRTSASAAAASIAAPSSLISSALRALRFSGRFRTRWRTAPRSSVSTNDMRPRLLPKPLAIARPARRNRRSHQEGLCSCDAMPHASEPPAKSSRRSSAPRRASGSACSWWAARRWPRARCCADPLSRFSGAMSDLEQALERARGGGPQRHRDKSQEQGKLPVRERVARLVDPGSLVEDALLANWEQEGFGADGVVTGMATIGGRPVALMANDPTVKAGSWGPKTVEKIIRIQEQALEHLVPMIYLVDSAGARITDQVQMFPGRR